MSWREVARQISVSERAVERYAKGAEPPGTDFGDEVGRVSTVNVPDGNVDPARGVASK